MVAASGCAGGRRLGGGEASPVDVSGSPDARIGFVGDVMLGRNVNDYRRGRPPGSVWGSTIERLRSLDGLFVNLECCLSDRGERRPGRTYYFRADPDWAVPALRAAGVEWASLANNHVLDYGPVALADTLDHLSGGGVGHGGAGLDLEAAAAPSFVDVGGLDVGVIALTDQSPTYAAGQDSPGTAYRPLDPDNTLTRYLVGDAIDRAREADSDLVIASLHWGPNWVVEPAPHRRAFARWLIDRGVDLVHGHSAHVIQGIEVYRGRPIVYDAGDFVDDYALVGDLHNDRSFLFELDLVDGRFDALRLVPVEIEDLAVELAGTEAAAWLRERMRTLSEPFGTTFDRDGESLVLPLSSG